MVRTEMVAVSALLCLASGFAMLALGWARRGPFAAEMLLRVSLAVGFGEGIFSIVFFLDLISGIGRLWLADGVVCALLFAAWAMRAALRSPALPYGSDVSSASGLTGFEPNSRQPIWFRQTLTAGFLASLAIAVYAGIVRLRAFPHGDGWDAFAIWNLHARFLCLGGAHWKDGFVALAGGSHPDYPLLLPAAIAHFWSVLGWDDPQVPALIGLAFTFATAGILFAAVSILRGRTNAMMATMALLSTPFFIEHGAAQYADVPLSFFFLAALVLVCLSDCNPGKNGQTGLLVLAGLASGFAAWTKNEGQLFACSLVLARLVVMIRAGSERRNEAASESSSSIRRFGSSLMPLLAVVLPALLFVAFYKHFIGAPGDLFSSLSVALAKLADPSRYWTVLSWYAKEFFRFGHWLWIPGTLLLAALAIASQAEVAITRQVGFRTSVLALLLTLAGYFAVFLITPYDIHWHLRFSLSRLFLQLWPSVLFLFFAGLKGLPRPADRMKLARESR